MRILHTSDWHLGATLGHASREAEHRAFLAWLDATIREREIELLLVAGDIFHTMNPPAEALALYYEFLAGVRDAPSLRQVVVIGGNHDSPSRLDAPEPVLDALGVHVVGGWGTDTLSRCLCPVEGPSGEVEVVVAAVPFVHEYRLGVRTAGRTPGDIQLDLRREFAALYDTAASDAKARWPNATLVATGHLTCSGSDPDDYHTALHLVRTVGGFSSDIFRPDYRYVALGHIHRMIAVEGDRVRYSGTPIALNSKEVRSPRYVLEVDLSAEAREVRELEVPTFRRVVPVVGGVDEVVDAIRTMTWDEALEPYLLVTLVSEQRLPDGARRVTEALEGLPEDRRPQLVRYNERLTPTEGNAPAPSLLPDTPLAEMDPEQVFVLLHRARRDGADPPDAVLEAFRSLLVETE